MSYPPGYTPTTSFVNDETNQVSGRSTVRTVSLDVELANISASVMALKANLQTVQRDDNKLRDFLVEPYALSEQARALISARGKPRGLWVSGVQYEIGDTVQQAAVAYICYTAHLSASPFAANGFWIAISGDGSAAASATAAALSESGATTQAATATTQATNAGNSATASSNSATAALASQSAAAASESAAAASYDSFDDRYLGAKSVAPTLDNDGTALLVGALYWNTATALLYVWTGTAWLASGSDPVAIQNQSFTAFTTSGSNTAYTIAPAPAIAGYTEGKSFWVTLHIDSGASPTLKISGLPTPPNIVRRLQNGAYKNVSNLPAGPYRITLVSATQALAESVDPLIVGTVSQSAGIPTGAIIERGSNANGEYVRFADGTQICWAKVVPATNNNAGTSYTSPATFIAVPILSTTAGIASGSLSASHVTEGSASTSGFTVKALIHTATEILDATSFAILVVLVGRWF